MMRIDRSLDVVLGVFKPSCHLFGSDLKCASPCSKDARLDCCYFCDVPCTDPCDHILDDASRRRVWCVAKGMSCDEVTRSS